MNRWKMHKLGFVNFWLYDREEFLLHDGHILLRGNNASGKSITTQSFIPFLLDGNKSPERLDPFGSRDRKMEYYLLGDGEREESTGYLYLEFIRPESQEYRTIGIGLRAVKGKPMDFWGFCLCDGRRVDERSFCLWEKVGKQLLPLTRQKLRNLLNDENNWAESPGQYKQLVNDRLFQFRDLRQYDQLIQLLIKVRTPKLSKDAFRPSEVKKLLRDSLQVLTDEDLSAMVDAMEKMDRLEETLQQQRASHRDGLAIRREYDRYNQYMLGQKGRAGLDAHEALTRQQDQLQETKQQLTRLEHSISEQQQQQQDAAHLLQVAKSQHAAMGEDDLAVQQQNLAVEQENLAQQDRQYTAVKDRLEHIQTQIERYEVQLRQQKRAEQDALDRVSVGCRTLSEENERLGLGEEHQEFLCSLHTEPCLEATLRASLQRRKQQIGRMLQLLTELERAKATYDAACQQLDTAQGALRQSQTVLRDSQLQEQQERDVILEQFARCQAENQELHLSDTVLQSIRQQLIRYRIPADWTSIRESLDNLCFTQRTLLQDEKQHYSQQAQQLEMERHALQSQLERLWQQPEPKPPRRDSVEATRIQLTMQGIPHAALYEVVDFSSALTDVQRDLLEAQLMDAGLLDALVIPSDYRADLETLLEQYPDRFLLPEAPAADPLDALISDGSEALRETVTAVLRSISRSDLESPLALLPDGRFRCGAVRGHSHAETPAGFVGAAARRANRQRQLAQLEAQMQQTEAALQATQEQLQQTARRLELLETERNHLPSPVDLDQALAMLAQAESEVSRAESEMQRCLQAERQTHQIVSRCQQQCREESRDLPYDRTVESYEEALDAAAAYESCFQQLISDHQCTRHARDTVVSTEDYLDQLHDQAGDHQKDLRQFSQQMYTIQARIAAIEAVLNRPENRERAQRRAALQQEMERQQQRQREAEVAQARLVQEQLHLQQQLVQQTDQLSQLQQEAQQREAYFLEELQLKFCNCNGDDWLQCARQAWAAVRDEDRERARERLEETMLKSYQQHNNSLLQYRPAMELIFDDAARDGQLRQRKIITLQWNGHSLSLHDFLRELQEQITLTETVLEEKDRELFESILTETISHKLRARIAESQQWAQNMTLLMATLKTSMGLTFRLDWKPKRAEGDQQLDTNDLVQLLNKDRALLTREDSQRLSAHFRTQVRAAREEALLQGQTISYADLIRQVLDYRSWYEFLFQYQREGDSRKELTDRTFNKFSGGEKAMAMYVPLFAAVCAQYAKGSKDCPRMLALDEAFAGVDERNISAMFQLVQTLDFDYIMNSQALWGCYDTVQDLDIAELHRPANASVVTILRYRWNGTQRLSEDLS